MHVDICVHVHVYRHAFVRSYAHASMRVQACVYRHACTDMCAYMESRNLRLLLDALQRRLRTFSCLEYPHNYSIFVDGNSPGDRHASTTSAEGDSSEVDRFLLLFMATEMDHHRHVGADE